MIGILPIGHFPREDCGLVCALLVLPGVSPFVLGFRLLFSSSFSGNYVRAANNVERVCVLSREGMFVGREMVCVHGLCGTAYHSDRDLRDVHGKRDGARSGLSGSRVTVAV